MDIRETAQLIAKKDMSAGELTNHYLSNISRYDATVHAYVTLCEEKARNDARAIDTSKSTSLIGGIPSIMKDNIAVKDIRQTASSKMLDDYITPYDATVVEKIKGSIILGKGNLDSFAFGASTENSGYGPTKNPWDASRVSGGSSGGPAAAVAADMACFGIGTDTGGSIRQPASFCGVVGLKPTYGRCSRYGLAAMGSSLDCPGPITKSVSDAAYILNLIAGYDEHDATTVPEKVSDYTKFKPVKGMKVGMPKEFFDKEYVAALESGVKENVFATIKMMERLGMEIIEVSMPYSIKSLAVYYIITPSEIAANMSRYDGIRYGHTSMDAKNIDELYLSSRNIFEDEVKRRIYVGNYALSSGYYDAYYNKAMQVRRLIINEVKRVFEEVDVIVCPTSPTVAFKIGEKADDPVAMYLADIYTVTANIAGIPGISIPCGLSEGLPVGFQIMGNYFDEVSVLSSAYALEQEIQFAKHYSPDLDKL